VNGEHGEQKMLRRGDVAAMYSGNQQNNAGNIRILIRPISGNKLDAHSSGMATIFLSSALSFDNTGLHPRLSATIAL
jgi:hypothetical protein